MKTAECTFEQAPSILDILNDAILNSAALYDYKLRTMEDGVSLSAYRRAHA